MRLYIVLKKNLASIFTQRGTHCRPPCRGASPARLPTNSKQISVLSAIAEEKVHTCQRGLIFIFEKCYADNSMERESPENTIRLIRAIRSLSYNRNLQPLVEQRIERAEVTIRGHLLVKGTTGIQIGPYEVKINGPDEIEISKQSLDDWHQIPLSVKEESHGFVDDE